MTKFAIRVFWLVASVCFFTNPTYAGLGGIHGTVVDSLTGVRIMNVLIRIEGTNAEATTDDNSGLGELESATRGPRYVLQYQIREKNGFNYAAPRQVRLGIGVEF